jgi:hypothetical protein
MKRRAFIGALTATTAGVVMPRTGFACGSGFSALEEEFIDLTDSSGKRKLLASHAVDASQLPASSERMAVSHDGKLLAYAHLKDRTLRLRDAAGNVSAYPAPEGATPVFNPTNSNTLVISTRLIGRRQLRIVNTATRKSQIWDEFLHVRSVTFTPVGIVVAHDRPNQGGGAISWIKEPGHSEELLRLNGVHTLTQSRGSNLGYFAGAEAFAMDLDGMKSKSLGTVPYELEGAAWLGEGLLGTTEEGAYWMRNGHEYVRRINDRKLHTVFNHGTYTVAASPSAMYVLHQDGTMPWVHRNPSGRLVDVHAADHNHVVFSAGNEVYLADIAKRTTRRVGEGRAGLTLRGARVFGGGVVTWSTRRWEKTEDGRCVLEQNPK